MKHNRYFITLIYLLSLVFGFWPHATSAASSFNYNTSVNYKVEADGTTSVTESYTVTNNTSRSYLTEIKLLTPTEKVENLGVAYSDGGVIPATTSKKATNRGDLKYDYQEISLVFPRQIVGSGRQWKFQVSYKTTGLVENKGSAHTVYVPSIEAGDPGDSYSVMVDVPGDFGSPHFAGAKSTSGGLSGSRQYYTFSKADLIEHSLALSFGDATIYHTNFNFPLRNDAPWPQTLTVALPPDLNNQKVYVDSLNPKPSATRLDEDGNVLADYQLKGHQQITVTTDVSGEVKYLEYDLGLSGKKADIPEELTRKYTKSTRYWQTSGSVAEAARKLVDDKAPVINNVKSIYQFVVDKLSYNSDKIKFNIRQGAEAALANPSNAVCLEYADLMIAMLRSQGIPARMPVGYSYSGDLKQSNGVADSLHAWVEAYVPGIGWMTFDPTWAEKFDQFGKSDLDHFAFAVWGGDDSTPAAVMAGGSDVNYQYEAATLDFRSKVTPITAGAALSVQRFVILPFLSYDRVVATSQPQVATDDNQVDDGGVLLGLGSLAPGEQAKAHRLVAGADWNKASEAKFLRATGNQTLVLATAKIQVNYVPSVLIVLLIVTVTIVVLRLRARKRMLTAAIPPVENPTKEAEEPTPNG